MLNVDLYHAANARMQRCELCLVLAMMTLALIWTFCTARAISNHDRFPLQRSGKSAVAAPPAMSF